MHGATLAEVEFHTGVDALVPFACRLLRKAYRQGARVWVTAEADTLGELDRALWTFEEGDFLPHVRLPGAAPALLERTPVWLAAAIDAALLAGAPRLLINLGADVPSSLHGLDRLIEVVSADVDQAERGRQRWRRYKADGLQIIHHRAASVPDA